MYYPLWRDKIVNITRNGYARMLELSNMVFEVTLINMLKEIVKKLDDVDGHISSE